MFDAISFYFIAIRLSSYWFGTDLLQESNMEEKSAMEGVSARMSILILTTTWGCCGAADHCNFGRRQESRKQEERF